MKDLFDELTERKARRFVSQLGVAGMTEEMVDHVVNDRKAARAVVFAMYRLGLYPKEFTVIVDFELPLSRIVRGLRDDQNYDVDEDILRVASRERRRPHGFVTRLVRLFEYPTGGPEFHGRDDDPSELDVMLGRMERDGFAPADLRTLLALDKREPFLKFCRTLVALGSPIRTRDRGNVLDPTLYAHDGGHSRIYATDVGENYDKNYALVGYKKL